MHTHSLVLLLSHRAKIKLSVSKRMQRIQSSIKTNVCNSIINRGWDGWDVSLVFFNFCFVSFLLTNELSEMIARSIHACHFYGFFWKCRVLDNFLCNPQTGRVTETTVLSDAHFASNGISQALPLFSKSNSITKHYHMIFQMNILFIVNRNFIRKCSPSQLALVFASVLVHNFCTF